MKKPYVAFSGGLIMQIVSALIIVSVSAGACTGGKKAAAPAGTAAAPEVEQPVTIRFAVQPGDVAPQVADRLGYFKEEGLDVELSVFSYGPPIIEAFTNKSVDIGLVGDLPAFSGIANGVDVQIVGIYHSSDKSHGLIVRDSARINSLPDLKGKKMAVPFGSNCQPLIYLYLEKGGLKDTDVEIINLSINDLVTSIVAGRIDAAVGWEPQISAATQSGNGVSLLTYSEGYKLFVNPIIARGEFVKQYPEQTAKFLRAIHRAGLWAEEHTDEAAQFLYDVFQIDPEATKKSIVVKEFRVDLSPERIDALLQSAEQSYQYGLINQKIDVASHIDTSYLKAAGIQ
jgi:aliphatic sulfonates family ABC transporter substrate-binding protein